jgi:hypothetical protein
MCKNKYIVMIVLIIIIFCQTVHSWNNRPFQSNGVLKDLDEDGNIADDFKGHDYIIRKAINWLNANGKCPFPVGDLNTDPDKVYDESNAVELILYGSWFADNVWMGPPESPQAWVYGILDDAIENEIMENDPWNKHEHLFYEYDSCWFAQYDYIVASEWRWGIDSLEPSSQNRPNSYLSAYWHAELDQIPFLEEQNQRYGGDNLFHYANENSIKVELTPLTVGDKVFTSSDVSATTYGAVLYKIGKEFWPDYGARMMTLDNLPFYSNGVSGTVYMNAPGACPDLTASLPSFRMGGNPFICDANGAPQTDNCMTGNKSTWPIWVAPYEDIALGNELDQDVIDNFHNELNENDPPKSKRNALIYLGWALHMLGDMSMPDHTVDKTGWGHSDLEKALDEWLYYDYYEFQNYPAWLELPSVYDIAGKTHDEMCSDFGVPQQIEGDGYNAYEQIFSSMKNFAKQFHDAVHKDYEYDLSGNREVSVAAMPPVIAVLHQAIKNTARLIACFTCEMDVRNITVDNYAPLRSGCKITTKGQVTVTPTGTAEFNATEKIILRPGFHAERGSNFRAAVNKDPIYDDADTVFNQLITDCGENEFCCFHNPQNPYECLECSANGICV